MLMGLECEVSQAGVDTYTKLLDLYEYSQILLPSNKVKPLKMRQSAKSCTKGDEPRCRIDDQNFVTDDWSTLSLMISPFYLKYELMERKPYTTHDLLLHLRNFAPRCDQSDDRTFVQPIKNTSM